MKEQQGRPANSKANSLSLNASPIALIIPQKVVKSLYTKSRSTSYGSLSCNRTALFAGSKNQAIPTYCRPAALCVPWHLSKCPGSLNFKALLGSMPKQTVLLARLGIQKRLTVLPKRLREHPSPEARGVANDSSKSLQLQGGNARALA